MIKFTKINNELKSDLVLYLLIIVVILIAIGRLTNVYIEHDDWDFMIKPEFSEYATPWSKTLSEGRWITFIWSKIAIGLSPSLLFVIFIAGYSFLCWNISITITNGGLQRVLTGLALFSCPLYSEFSSWPATTIPSVWIALLLFTSIIKLNCSYTSIFFMSFVMSLVYPPLGLVCLIFSECNSVSTYKTLFNCISYFIGFLLGIIVIYTLNGIFHDFFGIIPEGWRNFNKIESVDDLAINLIKSKENLLFFLKTYYFSITVSLLSILFGFINKNKSSLPLLLVGSFCFILDASLSVYTGMDVSARNFIWPWFYMIACVSSLVFNHKINKLCELKKISIYYIFVFSIIFLYGIKVWATRADYYTIVSQYVQMIGTQISQDKSSVILACGEPKYVSRKYMKMFVRKTYNIEVKDADYNKCSEFSSIGLNRLEGNTYFLYP